MPDYTRYPDEFDIEVLLKSAAYWPKGTPDSAKVLYAREQAIIGVNAARAEFEERTGWTPYLREVDDQGAAIISTREFKVDARDFADTGLLTLESGLLSLSGVTINGQPLLGHSVFGQPTNAPSRQKPFTWLEFPLHRQFGFRGSWWPLTIEVSGVWGFCERVPADVWAEIQQYATVRALSQVENAQSIASISQNGFSKAWDIVGILTAKDLAGPQGIWSRNFNECIKRTRRVV